MVKLTHWTVVAAILANGLITEDGSDAHVWVGYALAGVESQSALMALFMEELVEAG